MCTSYRNQEWNVQTWFLTKEGEVRRDDLCLDYAGGGVTMYPCHGMGGNQAWLVDKKNLQIQHSTGKCLAVRGHSVIMEHCNSGSDGQRWRL